eukprot:Amastigsp_a179038_389.p6 type:complete len:107 gc:universal Amastigsp_a179038_389:440-120(-)
MSGAKCSATWAGERHRHTLQSDSTALSRTTVSSTEQRISSGVKSTCAWSGPPICGTKLPSSSPRARSTSSSSSIDSLKNGISSVRVRSTPSASAMVERRRIELRRR